MQVAATLVACHSERSEKFATGPPEILRFAQNDKKVAPTLYGTNHTQPDILCTLFTPVLKDMDTCSMVY